MSVFILSSFLRDHLTNFFAIMYKYIQYFAFHKPFLFSAFILMINHLNLEENS